MSENLDLVRSIFAAWGRGDFRSTDWADPELELVIADGPAPGRWTGTWGMAEAWRDLLGAWEGLRSEAEKYLELDAETVLVLAHFSGRGRSSGLDLAQVSDKGGAGLFYVRDGKVTKHVVYFGRERALADLGLKE
jgi:ketosteroid isomerase-like protein